MTDKYHVAVITMKVKNECIDDYIAAIRKNAQCSRKEAGVVSFDVMQKKETPGEFLLVEVYKTPEDQAAHRNTPHFLEFREKAGSLLQEPYNVHIYNFISNNQTGEEK